MKKAIIILLLFILVLSIYGQQEKTDEKILKRVAVLDFTAKNVQKEFAETIVESLVTELAESGFYQVIERGQLEKIMKELQMQNSEDFNDKLREDLGNLAGAQLVFLGSVSKFGSKFIINIRCAEVKTGIIKFAKKISFEKEDESPDLLTKFVNIITGKEKAAFDSKVSDYNYIPDNKYSNAAKPMNTLGGTFTGIGIVTLLGGFTFFGMEQFYKWQIDNENYITADTKSKLISDKKNFTAAETALFAVGGVLLGSGISFYIVNAVLIYKAKTYKSQTGISKFNQKNKKNILLYPDFGLKDDGVNINLVMLF